MGIVVVVVVVGDDELRMWNSESGQELYWFSKWFSDFRTSCIFKTFQDKVTAVTVESTVFIQGKT